MRGEQDTARLFPEYLAGNYPVQEGSELRYVWRKHPGVQVTPARRARNGAPYYDFLFLNHTVAEWIAHRARGMSEGRQRP